MISKSDLYDFIPIVLFFAFSVIVMPFVPQEYKFIVNVVGMGLCFMSVVVLQEMLEWQAASYTHINMLCRPSGVELDLFVDRIETKEIAPNVFSTRMILGEKAKHPIYGELEYVILNHRLTWEDRMLFTKGQAVYKGCIIDHPKSAQITVYEPYMGKADMDHTSSVPVFWLKEAPRDYDLPENVDVIESFDEEKLRREIRELKMENTELKRRALYWHQEAIRLEEVNMQLKNELHGVLSSKSDQKQAIVEQLLTALEAHTKISKAVKMFTGRSFTFNKTMAYLFLGLACLGLVAWKFEDITLWLSNPTNQFFIIIFGVVCLAVIYVVKAGNKTVVEI